MDLSGFDKSPHVSPLLVRLYDTYKLYAEIKDSQPQMRAELTHAVTDLFHVELTPREQELLADVLIGLMRQAERDLRRALSEKLATLVNVPLRLVLHLANDEIGIAAPVLRKSIVLSDLDLIYIIKSQGPDYWQAIAAREGLSDEVIDMLADMRDAGTAIVLSRNDRIVMTRHAIGVLAEVALGHDDIARTLLMRPEMPRDLARRMYEFVGRELRDYIFINFGLDETAAQTVDDMILAFAEREDVAPEHMPTEAMLAAVRKRAEANLLSMDAMMEALSKSDIAGFIAQFAVYTGISARRVHDFLCQSCPKGMAIACRAFRVQKSDFSRIYLMTHKMRSKQRLVNHKDMLEVLAYFDKVRPEVAMRIVKRSAIRAD